MDNPEPVNEEVIKPPEAEPEAFWGYTDLCLFVFFGLLGLLAGALFLKLEAAVFHFAKPPVAALLQAQMLTYAILFGGLRFILRTGYGRPFLRSLGWAPLGIPARFIVAAGAATAMAAILGGALIRLPQTENQMSEFLQQGTVALVLMSVFGVAIAPLCEELAFRGFLQPLLARSFGAPAGILVAGAAFGLLHFREYGNSWRHALLLSGAGACFGWMRHATKSTRASVLMHASYNGLLFLLLAFALIYERIQHH